MAELIDIKPAPKGSKKIQKLTANNPDRQFLEELVDSGQVTGEDNSRDLQNKYPKRFALYPVKNFRTCFENILKSRGIERKKKGVFF